MGIDRYEVSCRRRGLVTGSGTLHWTLRGARSLRGLLSTTWPCDRIRDVALNVTWGSLVTRSPVDDVVFVTLNRYEDRSGAGFVTWNRYQDRSGAGFVTWNRYQDRSRARFVTWNWYHDRCRGQGRGRGRDNNVAKGAPALLDRESPGP